MNKFLLFLLLCVIGNSTFSQQSNKYTSEYAVYFTAEDLFNKAQYAAAREVFRTFIDRVKNDTDPMVVKAHYYEGISALELFNTDAILLLEQFNRKYPENIYVFDINLRIGKYYFQKEDFEKAQEWLQQVPAREVEKDDREELLFKLGYAALQNLDNEIAYSAFRDCKDGSGPYAMPSLYFFSHLSYLKNANQLALEGFLKLQNDSTFCGVAPYYIAQIYQKQGQYEEVIKMSPSIIKCSYVDNEADVNHIIGNAFYKTGEYEKAIPHLENFAKNGKPGRSDAYELGYAYYKTQQYAKAIKQFDKVSRIKDSITQIAFYQIGECYLNQNKFLPARSAFERAAQMNYLPDLKEDALYNFAVISFKVDINPYDESVRAFEDFLSQYPNSSRKKDVYQYLVNVYTNTSNFAKALESISRLPSMDVKLKKVYQTVAYNYGVDLFEKQQFSEAVKTFKLVDKYPIDPQMLALAKYWSADALLREGKTDLAISSYRDFLGSPASNALPEKTDAYYNIGYGYLKKNDLDKAIESFRIFLQNNPKEESKKIDAYFRVADCYYVREQKDDNLLAIQFYNDAFKMNTDFNDKALYYVSKAYGYNGQVAEKIDVLNKLIKGYGSSKYLMRGRYDLGWSYMSIKEYQNALKTFKEFIYDYPNNQFVVDVKLAIADIYFKEGNYKSAETEFLQILNDYGKQRDVCANAVNGLVEIYTSQNKVEEATEIADKYPCANISADEKENIYYTPAIEAYKSNFYEDAIPKFEAYLKKFPGGRFANESYFFIGNCLYKTKDTTRAVGYFELFLETPTTEFSEVAAWRTANYYYGMKEYTKGLKYYEKLDQIASKPSEILNAKIGLMRCSFLTDNFEKAALASKAVLETTSINNQQRTEAEYAKGISNYRLSKYDLAKPSLEWLVKNTTSAMGSEAKFTLAEMYYKQAQYPQADIEIKALLKMKPSYNFWVAKGLLLQVRIQIINDELFQAETTLKSVIEHYPNETDGIISEANELWDELMQLKTPQVREEEENEKRIEIND